MENKPAAHTPTPWRVDGGYSGYDFIVDNDGSLLAQLGSMNAKPLYRNAKANAAFIVRAVNTHEELLSTMKTVIKDIENNSLGNALSVLRFAIAKAEGNV